ncbi:MAG: tetratricopeptide repeat protein [Candidatus Fermentibacteraceae bacterium]|nr:tetratricopeptide repeat protein [Candidatus Fermentibacteraceae bacterium]MBN2607686.1 tetratricopeptide repeat protein [Candidatus Fermentibacteraceae bacterium]
MGLPDPAREDCFSAHEINPDWYNNRGELLAGTGYVQDAVQDFQKALELDPQHLDAHPSLGFSTFRPASWSRPLPS